MAINQTKLKIFEEILVTKLGLEIQDDFTENLSQMLIEAGFGTNVKPKSTYAVFYAERNNQLKQLKEEELKEVGSQLGLDKITRQNIIVAEWHLKKGDAPSKK